MTHSHRPAHLFGCALVVIGSLGLAACSAGGLGVSSDSPFAPSPKPGAEAQNPMIVGYRLSAAGEHELALKSFRQAAAKKGLTTEIISAMGTANLGLGRLGQAEELLKRATRDPEATPEDWNNLGVILMEKGETAQATQILRKAYALDNGESDAIRDNLRLALAKLDNSGYTGENDQNYKVVRRGSSDYLIRKTP